MLSPLPGYPFLHLDGLVLLLLSEPVRLDLVVTRVAARDGLEDNKPKLFVDTSAERTPTDIGFGDAR